MAFKNLILRQMRRRAFQPLWNRLAHVSHIGQNYWSATPEASGEFAVLRKLRPGITFDVGANKGDYAREAAKYGTVYAFEPSRALCAQLEEPIKAFNVALGAKAGSATLYGSGDTLGSLLETRDPLRPLVGEEKVTVSTLDDFCKAQSIDHIDLLKIDVEGFEYQVLLGAKEMLPNIDHVQFEFGHPDARVLLRDFLDLMPDRKLYRVVSDGLWPVTYDAEMEACLTINYLASLRT